MASSLGCRPSWYSGYQRRVLTQIHDADVAWGAGGRVRRHVDGAIRSGRKPILYKLLPRYNNCSTFLSPSRRLREAVLAIVGFLLVTCVYAMVAVAFVLLVPEIISDRIRMRGTGFCNAAGRLMTIITPQIVPVIFVGAGDIGIVAALSGLLLIQAAAIAYFGIETRHRSLEALHPQRVDAPDEGGERPLRAPEQPLETASVATPDL